MNFLCFNNNSSQKEEKNFDSYYDLNKKSYLAIDVKNAFYQYQKYKPVLEELTLQIPKGKIFALLGPNGTGKTTLLRAILGRIKLDSGLIRVFGELPGSKNSDIPGAGVGYMPQELALFDEFTVEEILRYFGTLYHMNDYQIMERVFSLIRLLNLPEKNRLIKQLSGGQQRRVSIAITMIHRPKLLILDEPTVGVDSLLRHRIWEYLEDCCLQNGQTVLITTHYIEEAKSAANVAFMNYGTILRQSNPLKLLQEFNCQTLETVFLILCEQRKEFELKPSEPLEEELEPTQNQKDLDKTNILIENKPVKKKKFDFVRIKALLQKYYNLSVRRPVFLYIFYFIPFIEITAIKFALGQYPAHIPIAIYNEDNSGNYSQAMIDSFDSYHIDVRMAATNQSAFDSVVNGTNYMSVVFGENFSESFENRMKDVLQTSDEDLEESVIKVYADFSSAAMGIMTLKYLLQAFNGFLNHMSGIMGTDVKRYFHMISVEEPIYGRVHFDMTEAFGPGMLITMCHTLPMIMSALHLICDRKNSGLERSLVAGVRPLEIFAANILQNLFLLMTQTLVILFLAFYVYDFTQNGSYIDVYLLLFLTGVQGMVTGFFIALFVKDEAGGMGLIVIFGLPLYLISGVFWPIEAIEPTYLRDVLQFGPICEPLLAFKAITLRGWSLIHPGVVVGFLVNIAYITCISILDIILLSRLKSN